MIDGRRTDEDVCITSWRVPITHNSLRKCWYWPSNINSNNGPITSIYAGETNTRVTLRPCYNNRTPFFPFNSPRSCRFVTGCSCTWESVISTLSWIGCRFGWVFKRWEHWIRTARYDYICINSSYLPFAETEQSTRYGKQFRRWRHVLLWDYVLCGNDHHTYRNKFTEIISLMAVIPTEHNINHMNKLLLKLT